MALHGFADESRRGATYHMTMVVVPAGSLDAARRLVGGVVPRGSRRTHLSAEGESRRQHILSAYARLPGEAHVVAAA